MNQIIKQPKVMARSNFSAARGDMAIFGRETALNAGLARARARGLRQVVRQCDCGMYGAFCGGWLIQDVR